MGKTDRVDLTPVRGGARASRGRGAAAVLAVAAAAAWAGWHWVAGRAARHLATAESLVREGEPLEALAWLDLPGATPATRDRALILKARLGVERRDLAEAVKALDGVDHDGPLAADFAYWKGRTLYEAGQPLLALKWFGTARGLRPGDADAARWVACAAYDLGDRPAAVGALEAVVRLDPKDFRAWRTLGTIFLENVEYERARTAFERALALVPGRALPEVRLGLAETLIKLGDLDAARGELGKCKGKVPESRRAELLAECLKMKGDLDGFREAVAVGLAAAPEHPGLLAQQAAIDAAGGRYEQAVAALDRAAAADPYRSQTFYQRGLVLRGLGRDADAARDAARASALTRGLAEMSALNDQAARKPQDPEIRFRLGELCLGLGKPELAASWYRAAVACDPNHEAARIRLNELRAPARVPRR